MTASKTDNPQSLLLLGLLGTIFVILKLTGVIVWSWWWVLLPFYGPLVLAILLILVTAPAAVAALNKNN